MLAGYNEKISPIKTLEKEVPFAGRTGSGTLVVAGPVDLLAWTDRIQSFRLPPGPEGQATDPLAARGGHAAGPAGIDPIGLDCQGKGDQNEMR